MDVLEQRVQALEQELQILKNQIQSMLLDIQEQVLSNTYPSLRSGHPLPPDTPPQMWSRPEHEEPPRSGFPVHKVILDDFNENNESSVFVNQPEKPTQRKKRDTNLQDDDHWQVMADLEEWAKKKIEIIGVQETADLIRAYTVKGRFTPEERDALMDFVVLHVTTHPDAPTQPSRPAPLAVAAHPTQKTQIQTVSAPPVRAKSPAPPQPKPAKPKATLSQPANSQPKAAAAKPKPQPKVEKSTNDKGSVVLRLIAGVHNAGAGIRWGKDDG